MKRRLFLSRTLRTGGAFMAASHLPLFNLMGHTQQEKRLGIALVGLGRYAEGQLAPALQETKNCYLAGIVTGTPEKADKWATQYNIPDKNIYSYDTFDEIANNPDIDIVYVVLPNNMHAEYTIRAAKAGKHVITEKPMATSYEDSLKMIEACKNAGKKLSVGYRMHFEPYNLEMMKIGQKGIFGEVQSVEAGFAFPSNDKNEWRLDKTMAGGGPLMDVGIYAFQAAIYSLGELPKVVRARDTTTDKAFFSDIEGSLEWDFDFPSKTKNTLKTSYEEQYTYLRIHSEQGLSELDPAYYYGGLKGSTPKGPMDFPQVREQAAQMDDFARCVIEDKSSIVRGEMGARDMFIIEKIYESAQSGGKDISLKNMPKILHKV